MATVKIWFSEFQRGRTSVFDEPRPGAPKTATTEDNVKIIHDLVLIDRRLKVHNSWDNRHLKRLRGSYPACNIEHEEAVGAMDAAFAHSGQQAQPWDHFRAVFDAV